MPEETVKIPIAFLKALYEINCVSDLKDVLKKNFAEVFGKPKPITLEAGMIFVFKTSSGQTPRMAVSRKGGFYFITFEGYIGGEQEGDEFSRPSLYSPMPNGTIKIKVKDGRVAGAAIRED